jgi:hypothetical protein
VEKEEDPKVDLLVYPNEFFHLNSAGPTFAAQIVGEFLNPSRTAAVSELKCAMKFPHTSTALVAFVFTLTFHPRHIEWACQGHFAPARFYPKPQPSWTDRLVFFFCPNRARFGHAASTALCRCQKFLLRIFSRRALVRMNFLLHGWISALALWCEFLTCFTL